MASLRERDIEALDETRALGLLEACNDTIHRLHEKLDEQKRQKHLLEQRILAVRSQRSLLSQIPDDLMIEIFKEAKYYNSLALGPILKVCRKWYNLAVKSPSLWANISLDFQSAPHTAGIQRRIQYAESAIRQSKAAPLDIDLTFPQTGDLVINMVNKLTDIVERNDGFDDEHYEGIFHWLLGAIYSDNEGLPLYEDVSEGLCQFMVTLAGPNGENLLRLRRFKLDYDSTIFESSRSATALHYPTPNLAEMNIKTNKYSGLAPINPHFLHPTPKLSIISVDSIYPIDQLLCQDQPLQYLEFVEKANFSPFPNYNFLGNLKHLCIKIYAFEKNTDTRAEEIVLPSLETLTIWNRTHGSDCIKAPRLETLRLFGSFGFKLDLSCAPHFPLVRKVHHRWGFGEDDIESLTTYIAQLPLLKEVVVLDNDQAKVVSVLSSMRRNSAYSEVSLKGYKAQRADLQPWSPPYPYERDEIKIDT